MIINTGSSTSSKCQTLLRDEAVRCTACNDFRRALNLRLLRRKCGAGKRVGCKSHTNYRWLSSDEMRQRLKSLHTHVKTLSMENDKLQLRLVQAMEERNVEVDGDLHQNLLEIMKNPPIDPLQGYPHNSFPRLFWESQLLAASLNKSRSMR